MISPISSSFTPRSSVVTSVTGILYFWRFFMACLFISNKSRFRKCLYVLDLNPSNCKYTSNHPTYLLRVFTNSSSSAIRSPFVLSITYFIFFDFTRAIISKISGWRVGSHPLSWRISAFPYSVSINTSIIFPMVSSERNSPVQAFA